MSKVLFASAHVERLIADQSLPARFTRLLKEADLGSRFEGKRVAVKMHVGGGLGFYTIHPLFVSILVEALKKAGANPFLVDGSFSTDAATARGYVPEVVGARVVGAAGEFDKYVYPVKTGLDDLPEVNICGNIADADALLVFSHGKGHGNSGFGGAIKNIAMGCVSCKTRGDIHALMATHFHWDGELCTHCDQCVSGCPTGAISFDQNGQIVLFCHHCRYCRHCVKACPTDALTMPEGVGPKMFQDFQRGMAAAVKATLGFFEPQSVYYVNVLMNITPLCDCWGFSTQPLVPDVGIVASDDIVAIEQSSLDMIKWENYIPGTAPDQFLPLGEEGHLLTRVCGKDPYEQVRQAEALGLGSSSYEIVTVS